MFLSRIGNITLLAVLISIVAEKYDSETLSFILFDCTQFFFFEQVQAFLNLYISFLVSAIIGQVSDDFQTVQGDLWYFVAFVRH